MLKQRCCLAERKITPSHNVTESKAQFRASCFASWAVISSVVLAVILLVWNRPSVSSRAQVAVLQEVHHIAAITNRVTAAPPMDGMARAKPWSQPWAISGPRTEDVASKGVFHTPGL